MGKIVRAILFLSIFCALNISTIRAEQYDYSELIKLFHYDQNAPLDIKEVGVTEQDGIKVHDIHYASVKNRVTAYLVVPSGNGPFVGLIFLHWGPGDRKEFLDEAIIQAKQGAISLLIDAPYVRPEPWRHDFSKRMNDREMYIQTIQDLKRGVDLLTARKDVDSARIGYVGHSFGATFGGVFAGVESRIKAFVLMAGLPSLTEYLRTNNNPGVVRLRESIPVDQRQAYYQSTAPLDPINYVGKSHEPIFMQYAEEDEYVSKADAEKYFAAAGEPKFMKWYGGKHELSPEARQDRIKWLQKRLGIGKKDFKPTATTSFAEDTALRVVYQIPGMEQATVRKNVTYKKDDQREWQLDLYYPAGIAKETKLPVVILLHGQGPPDIIKDAKEWGAFVSYGELLAASGFIAVTANLPASASGPEPQNRNTYLTRVGQYTDTLVNYLRANADALQCDKDRICVWGFSAAGPYAMRTAFTAPGVKCAVSYYAFMDNQHLLNSVPASLSKAELNEYSPLQLLEQRNGKIPPLLVMKSGSDFPAIKDSIDRFVAAANKAKVEMIYLEHPVGEHGFDVLNDDDRSRQIIKQTVEFIKAHLK